MTDLVVIPGLQEVDWVVPHRVNHPMLLGEPPGPNITAQVAQAFGLTDTGKRIAQYRLNDVEATQCGFSIPVYPIPQVLNELLLERRCTSPSLLLLCQGPGPASVRSQYDAFHHPTVTDREHAADAGRLPET